MKFENAEIDGMSLFDILESDLRTENLIPAFRSRKKFMRARMYLSAAYNITSLEKLNENMEKNRNTAGQQDLTLFDNTFVRQIIGDHAASNLLSPRGVDSKYKKGSPPPNNVSLRGEANNNTATSVLT